VSGDGVQVDGVPACGVPRIGSGIPLVARDSELAVLRAALRAADEGEANAVLLAGDAGVGKSRLLAELVAEARSAGATVLIGRCLDVEGSALPYLPFVEALGADWYTTVPAEPLRLTDQAMEQLRLFEAVHGALGALAAAGCVLLAVEDLHWADASTRDLVLFLLSRLDRRRLLVVGTYRVDDLHRRHPLRPLLAELTRLSTVERLELPPFGPADAATFVHALTDHALPDATVREIAERSEGNAFFCEELTAAYGSGGVPTGLAELLLARVEQLGRDAQRVVRAASGAGRTVSHPALREVSGLAEDTLEGALREAVQHNVLLAVDDGYTFRHALLREAVYGDLLAGERVRLHAGYAKIADTGSALAYHSLRCHDLPRAFTASVRAADEARAMRAPGEALHHLEQALQLCHAVPDPDELSLLEAASVTAAAAGEADRAVAYARSAVEKSDEVGDPESAATARLGLAGALIPLEVHGDEISALVSQAWDLVGGGPPSRARAAALALRSRTWVWTWSGHHDHVALRDHAERAIVDARAVGAVDIEIDALVTLAVFAEWDGRVDEAAELGTAAAEQAAASGAFDVELRALSNLSVNYLGRGRAAEALVLLDRIWLRAGEVGLTWSAPGLDSRVARILILHDHGEWADALAGVDLPGAPRFARARVTAAALGTLSAQGRFSEVEKLATQCLEHGDARTVELARIALADAEQWRGRHREAVDQARHVLDWLGTVSRSGVIDAMLTAAIALSALADLAERARRRRDDGAVREAVAQGERVYAEVHDHHDSVPVMEKISPRTRVFRTRVEAEFGRLRGLDDPALWQVAVDEAADLDYWQAIARWKLAAAHLAAGDRARAESNLLDAHGTATRLGAVPLRDALARLAKRGRIALDGSPPAAADDLLTPRERAVLELVATGLTNKQVGADLYISEKTASVHLSRVMAKLGAGSRTEAVSLAYDRGLLT